jgi:hypothetical protein
MARPLRLAAALLVWIAAAAAALAAADPLTVIPDNALGVAVINNLSDTSARVQKVTEKMKLPVPELLPMAQLYTGAQQGVDVKGTLAAAMLSDKAEDASWFDMIAVFVPVTDYKAFVAQLQPDDADAAISEVTIFGSQFLVTKKGDFAVLVAEGQKELLEKIQSSSKNVAAAVEPLRPWMSQQQAAIVLTPAGKKMLFEATKGMLDTLMAFMGNANAGANQDEDAPAPANQLAQAGDALGAVKDLLGAAEGQLTHIGLGVRIDDTTALHVSTRMAFVPDGPLAAWAGKLKLPKEGLLAGLPPDRFTVAYGGISAQFHPAVAAIFDRMTEGGLAQFGLSEENRKKYAEILARSRENALGMGVLMGQIRPGDSLVATSISVEHVKDAGKHMKLTREMFETVAQAKLGGDQEGKSLYTIADVTVGDLKALEVITDMNAAIAAAGGEGAQGAMAEQMQGFFSRMFGKDGKMHAYVAAANEHTVVTAYSKESLERGVAHVRSGAAGLETDATIAKTAKLLPEGAQWVLYVSPQGIVQWADLFIKSMAAQMEIKIPPFPSSDPIGLAARASPAGLDAEIVLPDNVLVGIGQYIGMIQQMMQGGAPLP